MADVEKKVSISYEANLSKLIADLKTIPGITEAQAKAMVKGLDRQLKQTSRAAKNAGAKSARGMKQFSDEARKTQRSVRNLRKESANLDRLTGELASGLDMVNPALGSMMHVASGVAGSIEGVARAMQLTNPMLLIATVAIAALGGAYMMYSSHSKEAEERTKKLAEAAAAATDQYNVAGAKIDDITTKLGELNKAQGDALLNSIEAINVELDKQSGLMTKADIEAKKGDDRRKKFIAEHVKGLQKQLALGDEQFNQTYKQLVAQQKIADSLKGQKKDSFKLYVKTIQDISKTRAKIDELKTSNMKLKRAIEKPIESNFATGFISALSKFDFANKLLTKMRVNTVKTGKKGKTSSGGMSKAHQKYNEELRKTIGLLKDLEGQRKSEDAIIAKAMKTQKGLILENLGLKKGAVDALIKEAEGEEKIALIQRSQNIAGQIQRKQHQEQIDGLEDQYFLHVDNLELSKAAVAEAQKQLDTLKKNSKRYAKLKETKAAEAKLAKAITVQQDIQEKKLIAETSLRAAQGELRENNELKIQKLKAEGDEAERKARDAAEKEKETARKKDTDHLFKITQEFKASIDSMAASAATMIERRTEKIASMQEDAEAKLQAMVESGELTQLQADKRKEAMIERMSKKQHEAELKLYKLNMATAIADVTFNAARAFSRMMAIPPPAGPVLAAAAAAAAIAQIAVITSAPAPTMHTGGLLPDETNVRALKGEAILSRSAVRQAGGESAINRMNRGQAQDQTVVVIQPFKHFDKFVRASQRNGLMASPKTRTGSGGY